MAVVLNIPHAQGVVEQGAGAGLLTFPRGRIRIRLATEGAEAPAVMGLGNRVREVEELILYSQEAG